jgi:methyl-accepting chemotaxis protein
MDFDEIIRKHVDWKVRLRMHLDGVGEGMSLEEAGSDVRCALARWLYGAGARFAADPAYDELRSAHTQFHLHAAEVLRTANSGLRVVAEDMLDASGEYSNASLAIVAATIKLRNRHSLQGAALKQ